MINKLINIISVICLSVAAVVYIAPLMRISLPLKVMAVQSGSMSPTIPVGSLIFVHQKQSYIPGDVVTFQNPEMPSQKITHRLVEISDRDGSAVYKTKGDANAKEDSEIIHKEDIVGKTIFAVPLAGYLVFFTRTKVGLVTLILLPSLLFVTAEIRKIQKEISILKQKIYEG